MSPRPVKSDFWSRRKAGVEAETLVAKEQVSEQAHALEMERIEAQTDAEILDELGLPAPESLQAGDDFTGFMAKAVPERLRRRALRQLWGSNPVLANVDGLVDYGEDFTDASMVVENMQSAYQVGKGMLKHVEEMARQAEAKLLAEDEEAEVEVPSTEAVRPPSAPEIAPQDQAPVYEFAEPLEDEAFDVAPRRRMRFSPAEMPDAALEAIEMVEKQ